MNTEPDATRSLSQQLAELLRPEAERVGPGSFLIALLVAAAAAFVVSALYRAFYGGRSSGSEIHRAFPLLGIAVAAIFVAIQYSLPLSLGLLGALSIVRFRTPIKEPEEIGFLMVVIAGSLACATYRYDLLLVMLAVVLVALVAMRGLAPLFRRRHDRGLILVSLPSTTFEERGERILATLRELARGGLESLTEDAGRVSISYRFESLPSERAAELRRRLVDAGGESTSVLWGSGAG